jgi:hypothetical protein
MHTEIAALRRDLRLLKAYSAVLSIAVLVVIAGAFRLSRTDDQVIRTRGIVIVDAKGHERILIGAPIPAALNRVRTDSARVRQIWGPRFPKEYLTYYQKYRHSMSGVLVLDENGFDRVAIGDSVPDPNIGRRIGPSTGMVVNDAQGFERTGYGLLHVGNADRAVLGLDDSHGGEGVSLAVIDSGPVGIRVQAGPTSIYLGRAPGEDIGLPGSGTFSGLLLKDDRAVRRVTARDSQ